MANRLDTRVKKIENANNVNESFIPVTKMVREFIASDGTVRSKHVKELKGGVWVEVR